MLKKVWEITDGESEVHLTLDLMSGRYSVWRRQVKTKEFLDYVEKVGENMRQAHGLDKDLPSWCDPEILYDALKLYVMGDRIPGVRMLKMMAEGETEKSLNWAKETLESLSKEVDKNMLL